MFICITPPTTQPNFYYYRHTRSSFSEAHTRCGDAKNNLPLSHTHSWKISYVALPVSSSIPLPRGILVSTFAVGNDGMAILLDSSLMAPTSDVKEMSFNAIVLILPPNDSMWIPLVDFMPRDLVGDSSLQQKKEIRVKNCYVEMT